MTRRTALGLVLGATVGAGTLAAFGAASAQDLTTVRVERSPVGQFQGLYIADELGYFKERGIKVEINVGASPDGALAQLMSNQKDVAMTGAAPLTAAVANGMPVVAVLNAQDQNPTPTFGLMVKADSPFKSLADLEGKKIGLPGIASPQGTALLLALEAAGMTRGDVELVNLPFPGVLAAIEAGTVDAGVPIGLFYTLAVQQGYQEFHEVFDNAVQNSPAVFFAANKAWADQNADLLKRFNEAMTLAYEYANANPDKVREIDGQRTQLPKEFIATREIQPFEAGFDAVAWAKEAEGYAKFGFISRIPEPSEYIWEHAPKQ
jgi:ABC-type nitrate/sulfonate/bicarbonate transport system substrate-binding protein